MNIKKVRTNKGFVFTKDRAITFKFCNLVRNKIYRNVDLKLHHNSKYTQEDILNTLALVGKEGRFVNDVAKNLRYKTRNNTPHGNTVLHHLRKLDSLEIFSMFSTINNKIIIIAKQYGFFNKPVDVAIDFTDWMYYGDPDDDMIVGTKEKNGTSFCYQFATINIVEKGRRFTLAVIPVKPMYKYPEIYVKELLEIAESKVKIRNVYVDRGFFGIGVINYLEDNGYNYLMPAKKNYRISRVMKENSTPSVVPYTMKNNTTRKKASFNLVIVRGRDNKKKVFATNLDITPENVKDCFRLYKKRWGIETSYRVKNEFRPKTCSKNYVIRLFYFMFSVTMYNLWVLLNEKLECRGSKSKPKNRITAYTFINTLTLRIEPGG